MKTFVSAISRTEFPTSEKVPGRAVRSSILKLIQLEHPEFKVDDALSIMELNRYRMQFVSNYLITEVGELTELERTVLSTIEDRGIVSDKAENEEETPPSFGQRMADRVAIFGGSWRFIILFSIFIFCWIALNIIWLSNRGFDPYPFILLNLILSCIASMQAPVIMMSQNRQEEKDRERGRKDYMVNLKSELEIRMLHEKLDHLIMHQQQELIEIQKVQMDMMSDILGKLPKS